MQRRKFGWTGIEVPVIGQGTWHMEEDPSGDALDALRAGLDAGATHVDTAEFYGDGRVETLVGRAIAGRREQVVLVSKVIPTHATRSGTVRACEASLRRLGTDHLDCYLLHWPGPHPLEETFAGFEQLVRDGKIRHWGVSNFDVDDLEEALEVAGPRRIACNQVLHHLRARDIEDRVLPWCVEQEVAVVGYSPFGSGDFPSPASHGGKVLAEVARAPRGDPAPGGPGVPRPRAGPGQCGRRSAAAHRRGDRPDRGGLPAPARPRLAHALIRPWAPSRLPRGRRARSMRAMCRNIRVLYNFEPPTTPEEVEAAALQYVRKVSGLRAPSAGDRAAFERAVQEIAHSTEHLLAALSARTAVRTREREREKARERGLRRRASAPAG